MGWSTDEPNPDLQQKLGLYRKRLARAQKRIENETTSEQLRARSQKDVARYTKEIKRLEEELAEIEIPREVPANTFSNKLIPLSDKVADQEATKNLLDQAADQLEALTPKPDSSKHPVKPPPGIKEIRKN